MQARHKDCRLPQNHSLPEPQLFDCLEFNDQLRQIDVLSEIAFVCMDLDDSGRTDFSALLFRQYCHSYEKVDLRRDTLLFNYYRLYRANVRAKVNGLRAIDAASVDEKRTAVDTLSRYLDLIDKYLVKIDQSQADN